MKNKVLVVVVSLALFVPFLGSVRLFDWDEINFAECAREMIETSDYFRVSIDYRPFYEKPPLFIWVQVASMKLFGVNEFAARFPNALIGALTLLVLFSIGQRTYNAQFGFLWVLAYVGSLLPHFYFRSGIIDPLFNLFIFLGIYNLLRAKQESGSRHVWLAGFFGALAILTKGPVGLFLIAVTAFIGRLYSIIKVGSEDTDHQHRAYALFNSLFFACLIALALSSIWFLADMMQHGFAFAAENLAYQVRLLSSSEAGHAQPFWYHFVVVLLGCFPASFLFLGGLKVHPADTADQRSLQRWMTVMLIVVMVVFSVVKTKIIHYSSLSYIPLTYLAAITMYRWINDVSDWKFRRTLAVSLYGLLLSVSLVLGLWAISQRSWILSLPTFKDKFLRASLMQDAGWIGIEPFIPLILLAGVVTFLMLKRRGKKLHSLIALHGSVALFVFLALPMIAPRIERYTQGAALDFYESLQNKEVFVKPLTMKSYAHLFYTKKPFHLSGAAMGYAIDEWEPYMLEGRISKPAYFVCKITDADPWRKHPNLKVLKEEGGFVFFERIH